MIKNILKYFIPPLILPKNLNKFKNYLFHREKIKFQIKDYEDNFYKRHSFVNKAVSMFDNCEYLEIGVGNNDLFNSIPLKMSKKHGVDPIHGGNYRMTSDEFFLKFPEKKFDVIFIDGLHHYLQCQKDVLNSINCLKKGGLILLHDMLPGSDYEQYIPRKQNDWKGDVWKVAVELNQSENLEFKIINIDSGIGIIKIKENFLYKKIPELKNKGFKEYLDYYKNFNLIDSEEALEFISN